MTSSRRIEQRIREDLGFRLLAAAWKPDHWTLNEFRKRHSKSLNDVFTQVLEAVRRMGWRSWGEWRSTRPRCRPAHRRIAAGNAFAAGRSSAIGTIMSGAPAEWQQRLHQIPRQLEELSKSGQKRGSRTDPEARYLRRRGGFCLRYTAEIAVTDDHLIVGQRVHQQQRDPGGLIAMTDAVERTCGQLP